MKYNQAIMGFLQSIQGGGKISFLLLLLLNKDSS